VVHSFFCLFRGKRLTVIQYRFITLVTSFLCLAVAIGSSIVTGERVHMFVTLAVLFLNGECSMGGPTMDQTGNHQSHSDMLRHGIRSWIRIALSARSLTSLIPFSFRPLFLAPLSEVFGHRSIYCISPFLYFIFTLPNALAKNAATLVITGMIAGLAASALCVMSVKPSQMFGRLKTVGLPWPSSPGPFCTSSSLFL